MALSAVLITGQPQDSGKVEVSAKTIPEIQEERKANEQKIAEFESKINQLEGNEQEQKAYQETLVSQITLIQQNISLLNTELQKLSEDINETEDNITRLDYTITRQQQDIDNNIEQFKQRLCAMYMSGNDSMVEVVLGSSSFYDIMTRVIMVNRMAEYDDQLIDNILNEISTLEKTKKDLQIEKENLETRLSEQEQKKLEKSEEVKLLNGKMAKTQEEIDRINHEQAQLERSKEDTQLLLSELDRQENQIQEDIKRQAEEAQRRYEEEMKKVLEAKARAEAEAKARAEAEEKARAEALAKSLSEAQAKALQEAETQKAIEQIVIEPIQPEEVPPPSSEGFAWPVPGYFYITSIFGERWGTMHRGIDIGDAGIHGALACASKSGIVVAVYNGCTHDYAKDDSCGCGGGYGNYVIIAHDGTYSTLYGHLSYATVSEGDYVEQGQVIGAVGTTGWSTGPHLHFEVRVDGNAVDPLGYILP